jgi:hypothetical protein
VKAGYQSRDTDANPRLPAQVASLGRTRQKHPRAFVHPVCRQQRKSEDLLAVFVESEDAIRTESRSVRVFFARNEKVIPLVHRQAPVEVRVSFQTFRGNVEELIVQRLEQLLHAVVIQHVRGLRRSRRADVSVAFERHSGTPGIRSSRYRFLEGRYGGADAVPRTHPASSSAGGLPAPPGEIHSGRKNR